MTTRRTQAHLDGLGYYSYPGTTVTTVKRLIDPIKKGRKQLREYLSKSYYGYGIVLLETVSGRRNFDVLEKTGWKKFSVWAYEEYIGGTVDKRLNENDIDAEQ
ncbi:G-type lectin S-receptor-like serine/threonine-protein kinase [Acorus gramineus]|uniref:G-type lectin S-receptor-like serine/threonine-protein kinase n=1 Tax=Acorus gramineus TaxID=55184 RepID=A0AAV8ZYV8_ACOGR|nr:G-type lectin S-receptor-like serine/threonine-protein kinase [Acorus gramineus]